MSSDSSSSSDSDDGSLSDDVQLLLLQRLAELAASSPAGTQESGVIAAAIQSLRDDDKADLSTEQGDRILQAARQKLHRQQASASRAIKRESRRQAAQEEWDHGYSQCRTRKAQSTYIQAHPRPAPASQLPTRTVSLASNAASAAIDALAALRKRNGQKRRGKGGSKSTQRRTDPSNPSIPLTDITNYHSDPAQPTTPHSHSSAAVSSPPSTPPAASSSPSSPGVLNSSSSSSDPTDPSPPLSTTLIAIGNGLRPPRDRITAQQDKKLMKRRLAAQADETVNREAARRSKQDELVGKMLRVTDDIMELTPLFRTVLTNMARKAVAEEEKKE